eukprot:454830-Pleurochrysis_carterae.AAC.2
MAGSVAVGENCDQVQMYGLCACLRGKLGRMPSLPRSSIGDIPARTKRRIAFSHRPMRRKTAYEDIQGMKSSFAGTSIAAE